MHAILPQLLLYVPATHAEQEVPPSGEERLPSHAVHSDVPMLFLNVCRAQAVHGPPFGPVYPAMQRQSVAKVLAVTAVCEPTTQSVQTADPLAVLYFPVIQAKHVDVPSPVYPGLQALCATFC